MPDASLFTSNPPSVVHANTGKTEIENAEDPASSITRTPIIVTPTSTSSSSQHLQHLSHVSPDENTPGDGIPQSYTLSNYQTKSAASKTAALNAADSSGKPDAAINLDPYGKLTQDDLLNELNLENNLISKEITKLNKDKNTNATLSDNLNTDPNAGANVNVSMHANINAKQSANDTEPGHSNDDHSGDDVLRPDPFKKPKKKHTISVTSKRPAFVVKLWRMINDPENTEYISWMKNGKAFQVEDREKFMKFVLPKYFKHNNFASFVRQLNMYGWHKIQDVNAGSLTQTDEIWQFENPNFIRDREDLLDNIVRNKSTREHEEEDTDIKKLLQQLEQMKRNQLLIADDLKRVREDNELLWKENYIARERHKLQSETLDKIMRFLASIYGNNTSKLLDQMDSSKTSDIMEINAPYPPDDSHYQDYNYYNGVNVDQTNINSNTIPNQINNTLLPNQQSQAQRNLYYKNQGNQYYQTPQNRRQLMIMNKSTSNMSDLSNNSYSPMNELRLDNLGYTPTSTDNLDSSIQEIQRGPENRNLDTLKNHVEHLPDYPDSSKMLFAPDHIQQPRLATVNNTSTVRGSPNISTQSHLTPYNSVNTPLKSSADSLNNNPHRFIQNRQDPISGRITPIGGLGNAPIYDNTLNTTKNFDASATNERLTRPGTPSQLMGNIHQQLHKNQGALKQVNDWLSKYNDNLDSDIALPDDFKVDDFLQQPLELNNNDAPIDFNNVESFINAETPTHTPIMTNAQLNLPIIDPSEPVPIATGTKRPYTGSYLNNNSVGPDIDSINIAGDANTNKRFKQG